MELASDLAEHRGSGSIVRTLLSLHLSILLSFLAWVSTPIERVENYLTAI